jgi:hypothetical protein
VFDKFKLRFLKARVKFNDLVQAETTTDPKESNQKLPAKIASQLNQTIANLPSYPPHVAEIQSALQTALEKWRNDIDAPNSLVILGSPVLPLSEILNDAIAHWQPQELFQVPFQVRSLPLSAHPHDFQEIQTLLQNELSKTRESAEQAGEVSASADVLNYRQFVMLITRLDWVFLRCINGLDPIEHLRNLVFKDASVFWLIGCNHWAWQYLDFVFQVSAYFGQTISLSKAKGVDLQKWLEPAIGQINLPVSEELNPEQIAENQELYFESLADTSLGITSVAAALWLQSLGYESNSENEPPPTDCHPPFSLKQNPPKLPDLPNLIPEDRYIIYSLLLHGGMTLEHLALSLGEAESSVKARVQFLVQIDAIDRHNKLLVIDPAFYPKLKNLLYTNNFLVGD